MISVTQKGDFKKTTSFLQKSRKGLNMTILNRYGKEGVSALQTLTPKDTGLTASSWSYKIIKGKGTISLQFYNSNNVNGIPIAILLQYGHATGNGGYVEGIDYINPALKPVFKKLAEEAWKEVIK